MASSQSAIKNQSQEYLKNLPELIEQAEELKKREREEQLKEI